MPVIMPVGTLHCANIYQIQEWGKCRNAKINEAVPAPHKLVRAQQELKQEWV